MKRRIKKNKTKKVRTMVAPVYTLIWPQMDQKRLGPLKKTLRRAEICITLMRVSVIQQPVKI
jgi:hypothetical protein